MKLLTITFLILTVVACKSKQPAVADEDLNAQAEVMLAELDTVDENPFKDVAEGDSLFASIKKGACFGRCPIYELWIYNSGFIKLKGQKFMEPEGEHTGWIDNVRMQEFVDIAAEIGYAKFEDSYDGQVTDKPTVTTSIVLDGKRKTVRRRHNYPSEIRTFEALFDSLLKGVEWKKISPPNSNN